MCSTPSTPRLFPLILYLNLLNSKFIIFHYIKLKFIKLHLIDDLSHFFQDLNNLILMHYKLSKLHLSFLNYFEQFLIILIQYFLLKLLQLILLLNFQYHYLIILIFLKYGYLKVY